MASYSGSKRLLSSEGTHVGDHSPLVGKRARWQEEDQRHTNCALASARTYPAVRRSTLLAIAALFPGMSDQDIASVLSEYGNDVDAAIRRLNELQLSRPSPASSGAPEASIPGTPQAAEEPQAAEKLNSTQEITPASQKTAGEWVEEVVREMAAARDLEEARARAARLLEAFEREVLTHSSNQVWLVKLLFD